jgi:hypothetical protein
LEHIQTTYTPVPCPPELTNDPEISDWIIPEKSGMALATAQQRIATLCHPSHLEYLHLSLYCHIGKFI